MEISKICNILIFLCWCYGAQSYKILVAVPIPAKSHYNLGKGVADILHDGGHEVTIIASYPSPKPKYKEIIVPDLAEEKEEFMGLTFGFSKLKQLEMIFKVGAWFELVSKTALEDHGVEKLFKSGETFDLVIINYFANEELIGLGIKFDCPVIIVSSISVMPSIAILTGNPLSPATVANHLSSYTNNMNLYQRTVNTLLTVVSEFLIRIQINPGQAKRYEKYFPEEATRIPYSELYKKVALVFSNSHPSLEGPRPLLPNAIEIGGYHVGEVEPLPKTLQNLIDGSKNGVILFSMGSNVKSSSMSSEMKRAILNTFSKINETVIWKFEEDLSDKPDNVFISKWLPQNSILAHKNVKFFITHGGLLSRTEAVKLGVPLLSIPVVGDQRHNARLTEEMGHGIQLDFNNITEASFSWAVGEMLANPKYKEAATRIANTFADRPMGPKELLLYYSEHVIRTKGASHLTPPKLTLIQTLLIDVALVMLIPVVVLCLIIKLSCKMMCSKKSSKKVKVN